MNIENFKEEFKIYCETVKNTKGLEFIKQDLFDITLNLENFIDDNLADIDFNSNMQVIEEAKRLSKVLEYYSELVEIVEEVEIKNETNIENFKEEFKVYCETVEDTKGLEILKQNLFDNVLNLETFIDDNLEIDILEANNEKIIQQAINIEGLLGVAINQAVCINTLPPRDIYKVLNKCDFKVFKEMLQYTLTDSFEYLYTEKYLKDFCTTKEKYTENWYIDLFNLLDKYNMI